MSTYTTGTEPEHINRLKVVLFDQNRKGKWLVEQLGKNEATVSRWCSNTAQPSMEMLVKIASILNVEPSQLLNGEKYFLVMANKSKVQKELSCAQDLYNYLYEACNKLGEPVSQDNFKEYITPLLYYRRISDVCDEETLKP